MANTGAKLSSFPEVNDIQTGDMFPLLSGGNTNAKIDYATLADAIIAKLKSEDVVQTQTNNANKLISAALAYSMNQDILQLEEDTSTEQEEKSVTAGIVTVEDADGGEAGLTLNLEPTQSGSGDPSPSNIRPISGWTGAKVTRCGKNLLDVDKYSNKLPRTTNGITWSKVGEGVYHASGTATGTSYFNVSYSSGFASAMPVVGFHRKSLYLSTTNSEILTSIGYFREDGSFSSLIKNGGVLPDEAVALRAYLNIQAGTTIDTDFNIQLEIGSTATAYEPYQGDTYDITFPSKAGTVYGGTLDVVSGELVVDRAMVEKTIASMNNSEDYPGWENQMWIDNLAMGDASSRAPAGTMMNISNFHVNMIGINRLNHALFLPVQKYGLRQTQWKADYPDLTVQICYPLATPVTYQLAPIEVTTLLGDNTIWMDAEGTIKLDYKTNAVATKGDVNDALARIKALAKITEAIAPVESSYTATQNYAIGDYLIVDYKLYKVTTAITSGATITEGTNVTATTIMAEIQALA